MLQKSLEQISQKPTSLQCSHVVDETDITLNYFEEDGKSKLLVWFTMPRDSQIPLVSDKV